MDSDSFKDIGVASPCTADWATMNGDERVRHCALCNKNVYNLSAMTRSEVEALIKEKEGKFCGRFFRRADGTILTDNCPVALRAIRRRVRWIGAGLAGLFAFGAAVCWGRNATGSGMGLRNTQPIARVQEIQPFKAILELIDPIANSSAGMTVGEICVPLPPAPPKKN